MSDPEQLVRYFFLMVFLIITVVSFEKNGDVLSQIVYDNMYGTSKFIYEVLFSLFPLNKIFL